MALANGDADGDGAAAAIALTSGAPFIMGAVHAR